MSLKIPVFVSHITNLSDARYCAGMGVEMLGFCLDPLLPNHLSVNEYHAIRSWVAGVSIIAQFQTISPENINLLHEAKPDMVMIENIPQISIDIPMVYEIALPQITDAKPPKGSMVLMNTTIHHRWDDDVVKFIHTYGNTYKLIFGGNIDLQNITYIISQNIYAINLQGTPEIAPGYKTFDTLADILEILEE
ncbi:MAG: hypothetical protein NW207_00255 [Cytophagales bacterium]|nr:hypothetical protein [Cytophagales bacterium]